MNPRGPAILVVLFGILVVGPASAAPEEANPTPPPPTAAIKVLQLNLCHSGIMGCYTGDRVLRRATAVLTAVRPHVLSVNEACSGDVDPLRHAMGASAALFVPAERPDGTLMTCRNGQPYGNIVMATAASPTTPGVRGRFAAQVSGDEMRVWACLRAPTLTACTTHLTSHGTDTALSQCAELRAHLTTFAATTPVILAGDLNLPYPHAQRCVPTGFHRKGDGDVQHVIATTTLPFVDAAPIDMADTTDHPGWLVTLGPSS